MAPRPSSMYGTRPPSSLRLGGVVVPPKEFRTYAYFRPQSFRITTFIPTVTGLSEVHSGLGSMCTVPQFKSS